MELRSIREGQATEEEILWRWGRRQGDEAILLNQANSNLFCRERGKENGFILGLSSELALITPAAGGRNGGLRGSSGNRGRVSLGKSKR